MTQRAPGRRCWAVEGTGCYGAGLASFLANRGEWVVEIDRPKRPRGRTGAKSDALDAIRAGREALSRQWLARPRQRGPARGATGAAGDRPRVASGQLARWDLAAAGPHVRGADGGTNRSGGVSGHCAGVADHG